MKILVSACLLGVSCRYDGRDNGIRQLEWIAREAELIPFCRRCMEAADSEGAV